MTYLLKIKKIEIIKKKFQLKSTLKKKAPSSEHVRILTGMEFHILGAACEKAL